MKAFQTILASAVLATTPISAVKAQSSYEDCIVDCGVVYQQEAAHCDQYINRLDQEYCYMAISQDYSSCTDACSYQGASLSVDDARIQRFRPVDIKVAAHAAESADRG
jgi:hypothetical protein